MVFIPPETGMTSARFRLALSHLRRTQLKPQTFVYICKSLTPWAADTDYDQSRSHGQTESAPRHERSAAD